MQVILEMYGFQKVIEIKEIVLYYRIPLYEIHDVHMFAQFVQGDQLQETARIAQFKLQKDIISMFPVYKLTGYGKLGKKSSEHSVQ